MRNKCVTNHVMKRDSKYYYVRHIPKDLTQHYSIQRLCFSLKTNSVSTAIRYSKSITQRLDDYWFGIRPRTTDQCPSMTLLWVVESCLLLVLNISFYWVSYCLINNHKSIKFKPINKIIF